MQCTVDASNECVRVTTCMENLEISGILTVVKEMSDISLKLREMAGEKSCPGKVVKNCILLVAYLRLYGYLVASS